MRRLGRVGAVAVMLLLSGCDILTGPEEVKLAQAPPATALATVQSVN